MYKKQKITDLIEFEHLSNLYQHIIFCVFREFIVLVFNYLLITKFL